MQIQILKSKIHRATITEANLDYVGSISIDAAIMQAADLFEYEKVHVLNLATGARIETYVIKAPKNSQKICINGAAAHLVKRGHLVIILSYCQLHIQKANSHKPTIVHVNQHNQIIS